MRRILALGLLVLVLTNCSRVSGFPAFDREQTARDELPASARADFELETYDLGSSRFEGSHGGVDFYLLLTKEGDSLCIVAIGPESGMGCSGLGGGVTLGVLDYPEVKVVPAPAQEAEGWIVLSSNVLVEDVAQ